MTQDIGAEFRALHRRGDPFILANAWDEGTAKMLAALGAPAIGTSSGAYAFCRGRTDNGQLSRDEVLAHSCDLVAAVNVPVSGDFESGYGAAPETVAETVRLACEAGLAGISIEDTDPGPQRAYDRSLAVERIRAAAAAARALPRDFVLVARADGVLNGSYDLAEALTRIRAFDAAGADCLYVPRLASMEALAEVCGATAKPVNALTSGPFVGVSRASFAAMGVARISLGAWLARVTHRTIVDAARAMLEDGDFSAIANALPAAEADALLAKAMPA